MGKLHLDMYSNIYKGLGDNIATFCEDASNKVIDICYMIYITICKYTVCIPGKVGYVYNYIKSWAIIQLHFVIK